MKDNTYCDEMATRSSYQIGYRDGLSDAIKMGAIKKVNEWPLISKDKLITVGVIGGLGGFSLGAMTTFFIIQLIERRKCEKATVAAAKRVLAQDRDKSDKKHFSNHKKHRIGFFPNPE